MYRKYVSLHILLVIYLLPSSRNDCVYVYMCDNYTTQ